MVNDIIVSQSNESLYFPVSRLIVYRFINIKLTLDGSQSFSWLSFTGASSYIVQLSNSQGIIFRNFVKATDGEKQVYHYRETLLQPGNDYLLQVEVASEDSYLDCCKVNNEKEIAQYVKIGINNIKNLELFRDLKMKLLAQLDALLVSRDEIINIIWGITRQGSNSEIICFLNYFLAQSSAFKILADDCSCDNILEAIGQIITQLAAANITLAEYLSFSGIRASLAEKIAVKAVEIAFFENNIRENISLNSVSVRSFSNNCYPACYTIKPAIRCSGGLKNYCGGCDCSDQN